MYSAPDKLNGGLVAWCVLTNAPRENKKKMRHTHTFFGATQNCVSARKQQQRVFGRKRGCQRKLSRNFSAKLQLEKKLGGFAWITYLAILDALI